MPRVRLLGKMHPHCVPTGQDAAAHADGRAAESEPRNNAGFRRLFDASTKDLDLVRSHGRRVAPYVDAFIDPASNSGGNDVYLADVDLNLLRARQALLVERHACRAAESI
jgi:hypothetical protein